MNGFLFHAIESLRDPRGQARWVMTLPASRGERWMALLAVSVISTVLTVLLELLKGGNAIFPLGLVAVTPLAGAVATFANGVITVFLAYWAGRAFGGHGGFGNTIAVVAWLQAILCLFLALQIPVAILIPPLLGMTDVAALVALIFLMAHFVAELHGFRSALNVFFVTLAIFAGLVMVLTMLVRLLSPSSFGAMM